MSLGLCLIDILVNIGADSRLHALVVTALFRRFMGQRAERVKGVDTCPHCVCRFCVDFQLQLICIERAICDTKTSLRCNYILHFILSTGSAVLTGAKMLMAGLPGSYGHITLSITLALLPSWLLGF
jgi:hypothetical protein